MSQEQLTIESVTGVDIEYRIAGPGSRSFAFVVDWHFRFILALVWFFVALIALLGGLNFDRMASLGKGAALITFLPPTAIYFLYHPILEVLMHGRTPGKRIAGIRIVTREGDVPTIGPLLIRNLFRIIDSLPTLYLVGLATTFVSRQHIRFGDMAAGTLLVKDHESDSEKSLRRMERISANSTLDPKTADIVCELIDRWKSLDMNTRHNLALSLLKKLDLKFSHAELMMLDDYGLLVRLNDLLAPAKSETKA